MEPEFYESDGTSVARPGSMARRVLAFIGMIAVIMLMLLLMWKIHEHRGTGRPHDDEPTIVYNDSAAAQIVS